MEHGVRGEAYNVGGGEEATMTAAVALAERLSGRELHVDRQGTVAGDVRRTMADGTKSERDLGWRATTALEDGLQAQWDWVAARVAAR
jgi:nucleoside-diphosphate-sugar epimerase